VVNANAAITTRPKIKENIRTGLSSKSSVLFAINILCTKKPDNELAN
jgi:hypothetical protein